MTYTYNRSDREVLRCDPNGFRIFTKYDILGRVILTGKHTTIANPSVSDSLYETATTSGHFYTSKAFPTSSFEVYTVNYYDDYDWEDNGSNDATYRGGYADYLSSNYPWVKGKLTRSKIGRLNQNGTAPSTWMDDILFYDIEGKEIQKQSLQQLGYTDTSWVQYDFPGRVRKTQRSHMNNTTRTLIVERFEYDHAGRLVDTYHKINNQAEQKISNLSYNERDELLQKKLAYVGSAYGQTIDYAYNIRKWLTQINDPASCGADLFSQKLYYTDANSSLNATAKYNGNIAWMEWRTGANCLVGGVNRNKAAYGLTYDGLDRVTASKYGEYTSSWTNLDRYNETMTYDLNGNISTLVRRGYISSGNWNTIDNLTYTYDGTNTNRVSSIADGSGSTLGYPASSGSFTYDASGNQVSYGAKGISSITYNHLNLPTKYTWSGSNLEVQYDASGSKLKKIPSTGNAKTYVDNIEYSGTTIEAIYHSEGRARLISSTWEYEYAIKDHLGNARVYFKYNGSITFLQESHYYPFGMEQGGWTAPVSPENKYKYNGKEYNDEFSLGFYDYGARWYDPVIGRWGQVDPLSEKFLSFTPFNYTNNNPINFIDPDGNSTAPPRTADDSKNDANGAAMFGDAPFNEYERIRHADGTVTTRQISDKGGDAQDIIHNTNGYPIPHAKYSGYTETVDNVTGGQRIAPGVFTNRLASGQISPVDDPVSAIEKGGANLAIWGIFSILKKGGKEVAESAAKTSTSLGAGRTGVKQWLQNAGNLERGQLIQDIEGAGFKKVFDGKGMMHFERCGMKIRLDPPQPGTPFNHMHLNSGGNKSAYDIFLNPVHYKSPAAHIPIR